MQKILHIWAIFTALVIIAAAIAAVAFPHVNTERQTMILIAGIWVPHVIVSMACILVGLSVMSIRVDRRAECSASSIKAGDCISPQDWREESTANYTDIKTMATAMHIKNHSRRIDDDKKMVQS